jgi:HlyD family secretion protein
MVVADLTRMEVLAEIDEIDVVDVEEGELARIEVDAIPDTVLRGKVTEIAHTATTRGRGTQEEITNFEVKIAILENMPQLRPGMSATVEIETETHENVLYVPIQSITMRVPEEPVTDVPESTTDWRQKKGNTADANAALYGGPPPGAEQSDEGEKDTERDQVEVIFVIEEGIAKMRPVATGLTSETDIEILSGLNEGDKIVIGSYRILSKELENGDPVKETKKESSEQ